MFKKGGSRMKKHLKYVLIIFSAIIVLSGISSIIKYLKSEIRYLKETFKNYGYNFSVDDIYSVLELDISQS